MPQQWNHHSSSADGLSLSPHFLNPRCFASSRRERGICLLAIGVARTYARLGVSPPPSLVPCIFPLPQELFRGNSQVDPSKGPVSFWTPKEKKPSLANCKRHAPSQRSAVWTPNSNFFFLCCFDSSAESMTLRRGGWRIGGLRSSG